MTFGILTLATPGDYKKAIGLALSARITNPGVPLAVACSTKLHSTLSPYFDHLVAEDTSLRGFEHKVHLDRYTPFQDTFFFDSDVLLFKNLRPVVERWADQSYTACGEYLTEGFSCFGLDFKAARTKLGKERMTVIDGAGHAYFRKPACAPVFDFAREVTAKHAEYAGHIPYADEDVIDIVMTHFDLAPAPRHDADRPELDFFSRFVSVVPGTLKMDARRGQCTFVARHSGKPMSPYMMHFAANEAPFHYARELYRLFNAHGVDTQGLFKDALNDHWISSILWPAKRKIKSLLGKA